MENSVVGNGGRPARKGRRAQGGEQRFLPRNCLVLQYGSLETDMKIRVAILTASDSGSRGKRVDESAMVIRDCIAGIDAAVVAYLLVPDNKESIASALVNWADGGDVDLVLTTGGTGLSPRDVTPEATLLVLERLVPGLPEAMRAESLKKTPLGMLSRGVAGMRGECLVVNLPGSPKAVRECLEAIIPVLPHAIGIMKGQLRECAASGG